MKALDRFGFTVNEKGYKVLPDHIRVIQGDGINVDSIQRILSYLESRGVSADNIAFGMGGDLLQNLTRDTLSFAMKNCEIEFADGTKRDVYKDPAGVASKRSKRGDHRLWKVGGEFVSLKVSDAPKGAEDQLVVFYENDGRNLKVINQDWADIVERARS
jgi:nicotinamide phosphoribosyltransferase